MIEVRCSYEIRLVDVERDAVSVWRHAREVIFPALKWHGRIQQMLMGHAQQSTFTWVTVWDNMASWEKAYSKALKSEEFNNWQRTIEETSLHGSNWIISKIIEPYTSIDISAGKIEILSSYIVPGNNIQKAYSVMSAGLKMKVLNGYCTQRMFGPNSQTLFTWSSFWISFSDWEKAIYGQTGIELDRSEAWFAELVNVVDIGGPREVYRII